AARRAPSGAPDRSESIGPRRRRRGCRDGARRSGHHPVSRRPAAGARSRADHRSGRQPDRARSRDRRAVSLRQVPDAAVLRRDPQAGSLPGAERRRAGSRLRSAL
ncbi:MAG: zinc finger, CDGSH-type domain protein, partial [uncultured Solirubrobacteraceae bacterium]